MSEESLVQLGHRAVGASFEHVTVMIHGIARECYFKNCQLKRYALPVDVGVGAMQCYFEDCVVYADDYTLSQIDGSNPMLQQIAEVTFHAV